jgi:peptidoglycan LD-endopeptidase CwlK
MGALQAEGHRFVATSGYRSFDEQEKLYAQGRTTEGRVVTNAKAGYSPHQWGIALDFAYDLDGDAAKLEPSWKEQHLKLLADAALEVGGLDPGLYWSSFKDGPHVQLDIRGKANWVGLLKASAHGELGPAWRYLDGRLGLLVA